ncbi:hypothetical protein [Streptomyces cyaneus]|uniref:hypothetical protein n=1 Tax=Streptomyces cyaneus TaxID=1904 RepID=UPI001FE7570E|nr:hypothetical protein [Streptomyces cyaneus]
MPVAKISEVTFTSADRVRDVIHNFNAGGFDSLSPPKYSGGRPAGRRPSRCSIAQRSRRSRGPGPPSTACRFRPGA